MLQPSDLSTSEQRTVVDLRLLPIAIGLWIGAAYGLHATSTAGVVCVLLTSAMVLAAQATGRGFVIALMLGAVVAGLRISAADPAQVVELVNAAGVVRVEVVVNEEVQRRERTGFGGLSTQPEWRFRGTLITIDAGHRRIRTSIPVTVVSADPIRSADVGATLAARALLHPDRPERRSSYRVVFRGDVELIRSPSRGSSLASAVRNSLAEVLDARAPDARAGATLLPGLVLGDTRAQSPELVDDLRVSGLSHLTAVSGANVAIVLGGVLWLLQFSSVPRRWRYVVLSVVLVAFVVVVQPQPSVVRAAAMGAISVYAVATGAARQSAAALWLSVIVLLIVDPFMAWQYGFALSVAATAGLIILQPWLAEHLPRSRWLSLFLVTLSAQLATLPILLMMGQPPTWLSIPANVVVSPLVAPATISGFVAAVLAALAAIPILGAFFKALAIMTAFPGVICADLIAALASRGADSDLAVSPFANLGSMTILGLLVFVSWRLRRRPLLVAAVLAIGIASSVVPRPGGWPPDDWWFAVCDVGQGDASVLRTGERSAIVIDVGPDAQRIRSCLRQLGVRRIDALVITHFHADHVEGLRGLLGVAEVPRVFRSPSEEPRIEFQRTVDLLDQPMQVISQGSRLTIGETVMDVLWPPRDELSGDPNTDSVVLLVQTTRGRMLLGADANTAAQYRFSPPVVDVLKVPHHGSRDQSAAFLRGTRAKLAIVSVGADNDYGHPAIDTLQTLRAAGAVVRRTDIDGSVALVGPGLSVAVERD